jgi:hypothetical protein
MLQAIRTALFIKGPDKWLSCFDESFKVPEPKNGRFHESPSCMIVLEYAIIHSLSGSSRRLPALLAFAAKHSDLETTPRCND